MRHINGAFALNDFCQIQLVFPGTSSIAPSVRPCFVVFFSLSYTHIAMSYTHIPFSSMLRTTWGCCRHKHRPNATLKPCTAWIQVDMDSHTTIDHMWQRVQWVDFFKLIYSLKSLPSTTNKNQKHPPNLVNAFPKSLSNRRHCAKVVSICGLSVSRVFVHYFEQTIWKILIGVSKKGKKKNLACSFQFSDVVCAFNNSVMSD